MHPLIKESVRVFSTCRNGLQSLLEEKKSEQPELINFIHAQLYFIGERSQTVVLLIQGGRLWDAEIIMRPIMEATIRILFVCYSDESERPQRIGEFWESFSEINDLKRSDRAKMLVQRFGSIRANDIGIKPLILEEEKEKELRDKWPKRLRQALEQKWSFSEVIFFLESNMGKKKSGAFIRSTLHSYAMSSHLIHADESALSLLWDRNHRPDDEREKLEVAHACRLLSDSISYLFLVWNAVLGVFGLDEAELNAVYGQAQLLFKQFDAKGEEFWLTQES